MKADKTPRAAAAAAATVLTVCVLLVWLPVTSAGGSPNATVVDSPRGVPVTLAPYSSFVSVPVQPIRTCFNAEWAQCAGTRHTGQTCCPRGSGCAYQSEWYSQCVPGHVASLSTLPDDTTCSNDAWAQCGGRQHMGSSCCPKGAGCEVQSVWFSQCIPGYTVSSATRVNILSTMAVADSSSPTMSPVTVTEESVVETCTNAAWAQCQGKQHMGPTCCPQGAGCEYKTQWFSQCVPGYTAPSSTLKKPKMATITNAPVDSCQPRWSQCGGDTWNGPTACCGGGGCKRQSQWFSQCVPGEPLVLPTAPEMTTVPTRVNILSTMAVADSSSPTMSPVTMTEESVVETCTNAAWAQCQGKQHMGPTCCPQGAGCEYKTQWFSQCVPGYTAPSSTLKKPKMATITTAPVDSCQPNWSQCGGDTWNGPTACCGGGECKRQSQWFSQCVPGEPLVLPTAPEMTSVPTRVNVLSTMAVVADSSSPSTHRSAYMSEESAVETCNNAAWDQCAGTQHTGQTCCAKGAGCKYKNQYFSQCVPGYRTCQPQYAQCGGDQWLGFTDCCDGGYCERLTKWYSQCRTPRTREKVERLCIFDFDATIKEGIARNVDVGRDIDGIVKRCKDMGYGIAIASANCEIDNMKTFLRDSISADIFSDAMLSSPAFQACQPVKTPALIKLLDHFGLRTVSKCAVFFDDQNDNGKFAAQAGVNFIQVDPSAGITNNDFKLGMSLLDRNCQPEAEVM